MAIKGRQFRNNMNVIIPFYKVQTKIDMQENKNINPDRFDFFKYTRKESREKPMVPIYNSVGWYWR